MSQDLDLSRRAVAAGWKWREGVRVFGGATVTYADGVVDIVLTGDANVRRWHGDGVDPLLPDFNDPATRGVLLQQVRERRKAPHGYVTCKRSRCASRDYAPGVWDWTWAFWDDEETFAASGDSETAALVAALEAAPKEKANG